MKYGNKDLMRIQDIRIKANHDLLNELDLAIRMAEAIELPGKALARGYAALDVYKDKYSPVAAVFFSRACYLSGVRDINVLQAMASMNSIGERSADDIEEAYEKIPTAQQPASRRPEDWIEKITIRKNIIYDLLPIGKVNVVKGQGPDFNAHELKSGTIEVWKNDEQKYRIIYTSSPYNTANIGDKREFKIEGKRENWEMVDFTEVYNMVHLMPLYGTSIISFVYS